MSFASSGTKGGAAPRRVGGPNRLAAMPSKAVLVTGCSSGIGHATAKHLCREGWTVYATARKPETLFDLEQGGCKTLALDVTDEASMSAAVSASSR